MKKTTLIPLFCIWCFTVFAQNTPPLERLISVEISQKTAEEALKIIEKAGAFALSYNPDILPQKYCNVSTKNQPVRLVLHQILGDDIALKNKGNYVILKKGNAKKEFLLTGYVFDQETGYKIEAVSIYEPLTLASTVTNQYGYYRIKLSNTSPQLQLAVRKEDYQPENLSVRTGQNKSLNISLLSINTSPLFIQTQELKPVAIKVDTLENKNINIPINFQDSIPRVSKRKAPNIEIRKEKIANFLNKLNYASTNLVNWSESKIARVHRNNIGDTLHRPFQISFLPFIGTNHKLSGRVVNDISINVLGGYSLGVRKFEAGSIFNLVSQDASGVQAAGVFNTVGGDVTGMQAGGVFNIVGKNMQGVQAAGIFNVAGKNVDVLQASGVFNLAGGSVKGVQAAGVFNIAGKSIEGVQVAGLLNIAGQSVEGVQAAGVLNISPEIKGFQIGLVNISSKVSKGMQIGLVNVSKENTGIPIGLLSVVGNGYKRLEIGTNDLMALQINLKTGVQKFYNVFSVGLNLPTAKLPAYSLGYGIGTAWHLGKNAMVNLEGSSHLLQAKYEQFFVGTSQLNKASLGFEWHFTKHTALFFAPTFNLLFNDNPQIDLSNFRGLKLSSNTSKWNENLKIHSWLGYQIGLRFER